MRVTTLIVFLYLVVACNKEHPGTVNTERFVLNLKKGLLDSMGKAVEGLELRNIVVSNAAGSSLKWVRLFFIKGNKSSDFVLLQTDRDGRIQKGRVIHLTKEDKAETGDKERHSYTGTIKMYRLDGGLLLESPIVEGYIAAFHQGNAVQRLSVVQPDPYQMMPEVVVTATRTSSGSFTYNDWVSLQRLMDDGRGGGDYTYGYYSDLSGGGGGSYSNGGGSNGFAGESLVYEETPLVVDFEYGYLNPGIDIQKYIDCFSRIPDEGATCSIEIFADIPVDNDPNKLFDLGTLATGHVFVSISKKNNQQSVSQKIGWYPKERLKPSLTTAPVEGKFVDNAGHELNASFKMNLSPTNLKRVLNEALYLSRFIKYDIDEYNCTDFALDLFNAARVDKLEIPLYHLPGNVTGGSRTPNGLYLKLQQMKGTGHPEANNITANIVKGWAGASSGPCN